MLTGLTFLDFKLIEKDKRAVADEVFEIRVKELEHKEEKEAKIAETANKEAFELKQVSCQITKGIIYAFTRDKKHLSIT